MTSEASPSSSDANAERLSDDDRLLPERRSSRGPMSRGSSRHPDRLPFHYAVDQTVNTYDRSAVIGPLVQDLDRLVRRLDDLVIDCRDDVCRQNESDERAVGVDRNDQGATAAAFGDIWKCCASWAFRVASSSPNAKIGAGFGRLGRRTSPDGSSPGSAGVVVVGSVRSRSPTVTLSLTSWRSRQTITSAVSPTVAIETMLIR